MFSCLLFNTLLGTQDEMTFRAHNKVLFPLEAKVYAIIETGGKQYRVQEGDVIAVELLKGDAGDVIALDRVLMIGGDEPTIGAPLVGGAVVNAKIVEHGRDEKKITFRYHNKNRYRVKKGHRQPVTRLEIQSISL